MAKYSAACSADSQGFGIIVVVLSRRTGSRDKWLQRARDREFPDREHPAGWACGRSYARGPPRRLSPRVRSQRGSLCRVTGTVGRQVGCPCAPRAEQSRDRSHRRNLRAARIRRKENGGKERGVVRFLSPGLSRRRSRDGWSRVRLHLEAAADHEAGEPRSSPRATRAILRRVRSRSGANARPPRRSPAKRPSCTSVRPSRECPPRVRASWCRAEASTPRSSRRRRTRAR